MMVNHLHSHLDFVNLMFFVIFLDIFFLMYFLSVRSSAHKVDKQFSCEIVNLLY